MKINDGGPAFPRQAKQVDNPDCFRADELCAQSGMSLRDHFAAAALQTIVFDGDYRSFALTAYMIADAMLAERERKPT